MPGKVYKPIKQGYAAYRKKNEILSDALTPVSPKEFYDDIFPDEDLERYNHPEDRKANMIIAYYAGCELVDDGKGGKKKKIRMRNEILWAGKSGLSRAMGAEFALCGMCTYSGRTRTAANAYKCYGFCFDIDGVGVEECKVMLMGIEKKVIPCPEYIVNSGHGLHLYYIFQNPVPLYPAVRERLQRLKLALTRIVWTNETSYFRSRPDDDRRDYVGIYQNFRMVGSCSKIGKGAARKKYTVTAYRWNTYTGARTTLAELNEYVDKKNRVPTDPDYSSWDFADEHMTLEACKAAYPEWYEKRIVQGKPADQWVCSRRLYNWWLRRIQEDDGARDGTRYACISVLFVFAIKCNVPKDIVMADALELVPIFDLRTVKPDNAFTVQDVAAASKFYRKSYARYSIKAIELKTHIQLKRNKRNGRPQALHLAGARALQKINDEFNGTNWREGNGRPKGSGTKQQQVQAWRAAHPGGKKADCVRDTGLSKPTVYKWWNAAAPASCQ